MDFVNESKPKMMWQPDGAKQTKMDRLRKLINAKYNVDLRKLPRLEIQMVKHLELPPFDM